MKYFLLSVLCCTYFPLSALAEDIDTHTPETPLEETTEKEETPPTYMECFQFIHEELAKEQDTLQEQINSGNLPATVKKEGLDVRSLNPRINPAADDVKASLQIDLPQKKEEDTNSTSSQCHTLYGLKP